MKIIAFLIFLLILGCESNVEGDYITYNCEELEIFYEESVSSILENNCVACHSSSYKSGNLALDNFEVSVAGIMSGSVISRINMDVTNPLFMPLGSQKLSQNELNTILEFSEMICR